MHDMTRTDGRWLCESVCGISQGVVCTNLSSNTRRLYMTTLRSVPSASRPHAAYARKQWRRRRVPRTNSGRMQCRSRSCATWRQIGVPMCPRADPLSTQRANKRGRQRKHSQCAVPQPTLQTRMRCRRQRFLVHSWRACAIWWTEPNGAAGQRCAFNRPLRSRIPSDATAASTHGLNNVTT